jgi:predicted RNase H-like nuclease
VELIAVGLDGARGGWAAACLFADASTRTDATVWRVELHRFDHVTEVDGLRAAHGPSATVAIDMPIGLLSTVGFRACDLAARDCLTGRESTVFAPPARHLLGARDYAEVRARIAAEREHDPRARGLSAQAAGLLKKVEEVDTWASAATGSEQWLFESHPETSFKALAGAVLTSKTSAAGTLRRLRLVETAFPGTTAALSDAADPVAGRVALTDLLDACAVLWTAVRCRAGTCTLLGDGARDEVTGLPMRIAV